MSSEDYDEPGKGVVYGVAGGLICWVVISLLIWALW